MVSDNHVHVEIMQPIPFHYHLPVIESIVPPAETATAKQKLPRSYDRNEFYLCRWNREREKCEERRPREKLLAEAHGPDRPYSWVPIQSSCPRWCCPVHSKRPTQEREDLLRTRQQRLSHKLLGADTEKHLRELRRRGSAPSLNCECLDEVRAACQDEDWDPNTNRTERTKV